MTSFTQTDLDIIEYLREQGYETLPGHAGDTSVFFDGKYCFSVRFCQSYLYVEDRATYHHNDEIQYAGGWDSIVSSLAPWLNQYY